MAKSAHVPVTVQHGGPKTPRKYAQDVTSQACALLGHAFNVCNNPDLPYRYSKAAIAEFKEAFSRIIVLIDEGEIVELPHVMARKDARFQRFMGALTAPDE